MGWLQTVEPVVTVTIQTSLRCPVGYRSRKETQEESLEPIEDDQVYGDSSAEHPADYPGPFACAEKCLPGRHCKEKKKEFRLVIKLKKSPLACLPSLRVC